MFSDTTISTIITALERQERLLAEDYGKTKHDRTKVGLHNTINTLALLRSMSRGDIIALLWSIEDIKHLADDESGEPIPGVSISDAEARDVLALARSEHDSDRGVNWDVLDEHLNTVKSERSHV